MQPDDEQAPSPRRGRPGHDRAEVVRVATELFTRQGYDGTSVGDVARELGVTKSAIYHHVSGKEQLLELAVSDGLDALRRALDEVTEAPALDPGPRLGAAVRASVVVLVAHLSAVRLLLGLHGNTPVAQAVLARRRSIDQRLAAMVTEAVADGAVRDDLDPLLTSRLPFGMVNSLTSWLRPGADGPDLADAVTTLAFDGLTRRSRA